VCRGLGHRLRAATAGHDESDLLLFARGGLRGDHGWRVRARRNLGIGVRRRLLLRRLRVRSDLGPEGGPPRSLGNNPVRHRYRRRRTRCHDVQAARRRYVALLHESRESRRSARDRAELTGRSCRSRSRRAAASTAAPPARGIRRIRGRSLDRHLRLRLADHDHGGGLHNHDRERRCRWRWRPTGSRRPRPPPVSEPPQRGRLRSLGRGAGLPGVRRAPASTTLHGGSR
jgi:hypothetical protein